MVARVLWHEYKACPMAMNLHTRPIESIRYGKKLIGILMRELPTSEQKNIRQKMKNIFSGAKGTDREVGLLDLHDIRLDVSEKVLGISDHDLFCRTISSPASRLGESA